MAENLRNKGNIQKKRVRMQQNVITSLCLLCLVFCVGWSVYAAQSSGAVQVEPVGNVNDSRAKDDSKAPVEESSEEEYVSQPSSETDSKDVSDSSEDVSEVEDDSSEIKPDTKNDDLSDAVFIGDSRTMGMKNSTDKPKATFYCAVGLHVDTALTAKDVFLENGKTGCIVDALKKRQFARVYVNFGVNELGWPYPDVFKQKYSEVLQKIKELQPNAVVYAESILPVTASRAAKGDAVNNDNVVQFNELIKQAAEENGAKYLDCTAAVADENGYLPEDASTDGVHLTAEYCLKWQNYIIDNT